MQKYLTFQILGSFFSLLYFSDFAFVVLGWSFVTYVLNIVIILLIISRFRQVLALMMSNQMLMLLLAYIFISCSWAIDPLGSLFVTRKIVLACLFGFFLVSKFTAKELLYLACAAMIVMIFGSIFFVKFIPGTVDNGAWAGAFTTKNMLSIRMVLAAPLLVFGGIYLERRRLKFIFFFCAFSAAYLVVKSQSSTGLIVLAAMIILPVIVRVLQLRPMLILTVMAMLVCAIGMILQFADAQTIKDVFFGALGKDSTLTGRVDTWRGIIYALTDYRSSRVWEGYGPQDLLYTSDGEIVAYSQGVMNGGVGTVDGWLVAWDPSSIYMDIILKYGLIGSAIFAIVLWKALWVATAQASRGVDVLRSWHLTFMYILFINGITEVIDGVAICWVFFAMILAIGLPYTSISSQSKAYAV